MSEHGESETIYKSSKINRGLLIVLVIGVAWEGSEILKVRRQTSKWQIQIVENKLAVEANTKTIIDSIKQWNTSQQEMSNWMRANQVAIDKLHEDNPKLKVPKAPPIPKTLPTPNIILTDKDLTRPATPQPVVKEKKHRKRARPTPTPSFWDKLWHKKMR